MRTLVCLFVLGASACGATPAAVSESPVSDSPDGTPITEGGENGVSSIEQYALDLLATVRGERNVEGIVDWVHVARGGHRTELLDHSSAVDSFAASLRRRNLLHRMQLQHRQLGHRFSVRAIEFRGQPAVRLRRIDGVSVEFSVFVRPVDAPNGAIDVYMFSQGHWLSETLHETLMLIATAPDEEARARTGRLLHEFEQLGEAQRWPEVLAAYDALPPSIQSLKVVVSARIVAALNTDDELCRRLIREQINNSADPVWVHLMQLEYSLLHLEDMEGLRAVLRALDRDLPDSFWPALSAMTVCLEQNNRGCLEANEAVIAEDPDIQLAYGLGILAAGFLGENEKANEMLGALLTRFSAVDRHELAGRTGYAFIRNLPAFASAGR